MRAASSKLTKREALILAGSAVVIALSMAANRSKILERGAVDSERETAPTLSPLPSGAQIRSAPEIVPDESESSGCHFPDNGFGHYGRWRSLPLGRVLISDTLALDDNGGYP